MRSKKRKILTRNRDFANRAEYHHDLKEWIEIEERKLRKLGLREDMYDQYGGSSRTIAVFKSPRGLKAQLIVAQILIRDEKELRRKLGAEFRYPLVRREVLYTVDIDVLKKRIRQQRLPADIQRRISTEKVSFKTYVPMPNRLRKDKKE